jgi:hypothetical protein
VAATIAGLVGPDVDAFGDRTALRSAGGDGPDRTYDYDRLRTETHKTGNFLSHQGVRDGRRVGVVADSPPAPEAVLALLGAALTGAVVRFDPPRAFDGRAVLAPVDRAEAYDLPPGGRRIAYGGAPADPATVHFEEAMWSENPTFPPPRVDPADPLLSTGERTFSHGGVADAARSVVEGNELDADAVVALRAPLAEPAVVASVAGALLAGATVLLPGGDAATASDVDAPVGTHAVAPAGADVPEPVRVDLVSP